MSSREEWINKDLLRYNIQLEDIGSLDKYDEYTAEKALSVLLGWACYGQHIEGIELGRREIAKIPRAWLKSHLLAVVKNDFEYSDYWNYRRLLELVVELAPELKNDILSINSGTTNPDLIDVIDDYK